MIAPQDHQDHQDHQTHAELGRRQLSHRYDGLAKVTGRAKYAAEFPVENIAYAYVVQATIPSGTIASIDQAAATRAAGVLLHHYAVQRAQAHRPWQRQHPSGHQRPLQRPAYRRRRRALSARSRASRKAPPHRVQGAASQARLQRLAQGRSRPQTRRRRLDTAAIPRPRSLKPQSSSTRPTRRPSRTTIRWSRTPPSPHGKATN